MTTYFPELDRLMQYQRELPELYGALDFDTRPYRLTTDPAVASALPGWVARREPLLADDRIVELVATATMLGDVAADPYAALSATRSVTELIELVRLACRAGLDAVPDAPPELVRFIESMTAPPDWIDMTLVADGARRSKIDAALLAPFLIRGAFVATFTNTYAALPMALTGALSGRRAARRVNETAAFFALTTLPGALDRYGPGFEAAALVRLMHSLVRCHALTRAANWDPSVYGMPVPQIDQLPAGMIQLYLMAQRALRAGRTEFTAGERAVVEFSRYRCFLLGLPEELVPATATDIVRLINARAALLRDGFDDETCGRLVRSTMDAYLRAADTRFDRLADAVEKSYSKLGFTQAFCHGSRRAAAAMGVHTGPADYARVAVTAPFIVGRVLAVGLAVRNRRLRPLVDRYLDRTIARRLVGYGKPEYRTDAGSYAELGSAGVGVA
ncbi:oxygenase MpaB family protein [Skermania piniformis]|uniref:DUF2236 domain-containing protein n=1 Tax=Skermania pinensis TaxID=39122 RepID=A0ABX8S914_9ACTN|nr:oxygenase MpaB family protein [Skermania piniformis]QXQ14263.1 DUF2236 domain-containing protein [Skermania piniformis]